jgi:hypothetical protein
MGHIIQGVEAMLGDAGEQLDVRDEVIKMGVEVFKKGKWEACSSLTEDIYQTLDSADDVLNTFAKRMDATGIRPDVLGPASMRHCDRMPTTAFLGSARLCDAAGAVRRFRDSMRLIKDDSKTKDLRLNFEKLEDVEITLQNLQNFVQSVPAERAEDLEKLQPIVTTLSEAKAEKQQLLMRCLLNPLIDMAEHVKEKVKILDLHETIKTVVQDKPEAEWISGLLPLPRGAFARNMLGAVSMCDDAVKVSTVSIGKYGGGYTKLLAGIEEHQQATKHVEAARKAMSICSLLQVMFDKAPPEAKAVEVEKKKAAVPLTGSLAVPKALVELADRLIAAKAKPKS